MTSHRSAEAAAIEAEALATLDPLGPTGRRFVGVLVAVAVWGLFAYVWQVVYGLRVTAMRDYASWGFYIATFVFYVGISHVGALLSAILRLTGAEWRRPLTRMAEAITFASLFMAGLMPFVDMGRPDRMQNLILYGRLQSPILWDIFCIATYFIGSSLFLYLPMIPDLALCRDRLACSPRWKRVYTMLALGWRGTPEQHRRLERCVAILTAIIIPIAISVHTVVSWIFGMTLRAGWNSTILGPYFVSGALMSGAASVVLAMAVFRRAYRIERYVTDRHMNNMGLILFTLVLIYLYFNLCEYWTPAYKMATAEAVLLNDLFYGPYSPYYWTTQILSVGVPLLVLAFPFGRRGAWLIAAAALNVVGAWIKRYLIVVPTMLHPFLPIQGAAPGYADYFPSFVEWSIVLGSFAGFLLIYIGISRLVPIFAVWEVAEAPEAAGIETSRETGAAACRVAVPREGPTC